MLAARIALTALLLVAASGCKNKDADAPAPAEPEAKAHAEAEAKGHAGHEEEAHAAKEQAEHAGHEAHAEHAATKLALDGDRKWQMDDHTRAALAAIEARLAKGPATEDVAGHQALGADLDAELQGLVRGCTMTGPAHDQLHVWLTAFIPAVGALKDGGDLAHLEAKRAELTGLVADARKHFE